MTDTESTRSLLVLQVGVEILKDVLARYGFLASSPAAGECCKQKSAF